MVSKNNAKSIHEILAFRKKNQIPSFYSSRDLILKVMGGKASNILFFLPFQAYTCATNDLFQI